MPHPLSKSRHQLDVASRWKSEMNGPHTFLTNSFPVYPVPNKPALTTLPSLGSVLWQFTLLSSTLMNYKLTATLHVQQINFILEHTLLSNYHHHSHLRHGPTPTLHIVTKSQNSACSISHDSIQQNNATESAHVWKNIGDYMLCTANRYVTHLPIKAR